MGDTVRMHKPTLRERIEAELEVSRSLWLHEAAKGDDPVAMREERIRVRELRAALAELDAEGGA